LLSFLQKLKSFRGLVIAVILSSTISGGLVFRQLQNANHIDFEIEISSSADGLVQVFYDRGHGYREEDSESLVLHASEVPLTYEFRMPAANIKSLRFDPNNIGGTFVISHPRFIGAAGKEIRSIPLASFSPSKQISSVVRNENQLRIEVPPENTDPVMVADLQPSLRPWYAYWRGLDLDVASALTISLIVWILVFASAAVQPTLSKIVVRAALSVKLSPHRTVILISLVSLVSVVLSCYPVVFFGKSFVSPNNGGAAQLYAGAPFLPGGSDLKNENVRSSDVGAMMWAFRPYSVVQNRAISQGEFPLWNQFNSAGTTLLAQGISMIGDPLHWMTVAADGSALSWDAKFVIAKFLFCLCAGFLVFIVTSNLTSAVVIASSSAFLGFFIYRFNHPAFFSLSYAPMLLLGWAGVLRADTLKESRLFILLLVLSMLMELNSGTAKEAYILTILLNGTGALALLFQRWSWREKANKFVLLSIVGLATALLLAPFWLVFLDELTRAYTLYSSPQARVFPFQLFAGFFDEIFYAQAAPHREVTGPAINLLIGGSLLWGIACASRLRREPWFMACLIGGILSASIAFGILPPSLIVKIPVLRNVGHVGNTLSCVLLIQSLVVAGFGVREFQRSVSSNNWHRDFVKASLLMSAIALGYALRIPSEPRWSTWAIVFATMPLIGLFVTIVVSKQVFAGAVTARNLWILVVCFFAIHLRLGQQLETGDEGFDLYLANPHPRPDFSARSPALELLPPPDGAPYRVVGIDGILFSGYQASLSVESINGPDALVNNHFRELEGVLGFEQMYGWGWLVEVHPDDLRRISKGLDALNVRYVLFPTTAKLPPDLLVVGRRDLTVVERPTAWPRAYFEDNVSIYRDLDDLQRLIADSKNPIAVVQSGDEKAPGAIAGKGVVVAATDYRTSSNSVTFSVDAPSGGVAVLGEAFVDRSFIATLNGKTVDWFRINHAFKGVLIPEAGKYVISFRYRPPLFDLSLALSAIGALLLGLLLFLSRQSFLLRVRKLRRRSLQAVESGPTDDPNTETV
jgi:hypothetical protein